MSSLVNKLAFIMIYQIKILFFAANEQDSFQK